VFNVFGDPTPGPRHLHGFQSCGFPWKVAVDTYTEVKSEDSYRMSMRLSREGLIAGPSSGEALQGLLDYIEGVKAAGKLADLADPSTGEVSCVFTCSDLPYQYLDGYFTKLGEDEFPPIHNEVLLQIVPMRSAELIESRYFFLVTRTSMTSDGSLSQSRHWAYCSVKIKHRHQSATRRARLAGMVMVSDALTASVTRNLDSRPS
jgi:hypothetical protein